MTARHIRLAIISATGVIALAGVVLGAEGIASATVTQQVASRAPAGTRIRPAGPVLLGLMSGTLPVEAQLDVEALATLTKADRVELGDVVEITTTRTSKLGTLPVTVGLQPTVTDHELTWTVVSASAAGIEIPAARVARLAPPRVKGLPCVSVTGVAIEPTHLVVTGDISLRPDGSPSCHG
ncbi:MAG: hypothetical protein CVT62_13205 [Actinobacteria bacterium HGW-Actinobacteria-2]|nr:MAG: hypothetical protein CVT62_13205 [Actinobacteria bacterium HGW-Actinobacteria-2]